MKRKQWSEESMLAAMVAVRSGTSVKRAAIEHGVPRTTLQDRHLGKVTHGTNPGPWPYLDKSEEKELRDFIITVGQVGYILYKLKRVSMEQKGKKSRTVLNRGELRYHRSPLKTITCPTVRQMLQIIYWTTGLEYWTPFDLKEFSLGHCLHH